MMEALCILSFTGNGIAIAAYFAAAVVNNTARVWIDEWSSNDDVSRFTSGYFLIFAALYLLSLTGVLGMWKMKKRGFFLYVLAQAGILVLPSLWLGVPSFPSVVVIFTLLFITLYAREIFRRPPHSLDP